MKLKMFELINIRKGLNEFGKLVPPSGAIALAFARIGRKINPDMEAMQEAEQSILLKYAIKDEKGNPIRLKDGAFDIPDDKWNEFQQDKMNLLSSEIEIDITPIKWADVEQMKGITPLMLELLDKIIELPEV